MGGVFKIVDKDGQVTYTDRPADVAGSSVRPWRPGDPGRPNPKPPAKTPAQKDYDTAKADIALARKHIPNLVQYLEYLDYLRHHSPIRFDRMMKELQHDDPQVWLKLQKYPQFQPLSRALGMAKAGENRLTLTVGIAVGNYGGSIDKWAESTLKDLMKRDSYYADVLGAKATTLAQPPRPTYSSSKLGQYMAREVPRQEAAAVGAAKELEKGRAAVRTGAATAFSRVGGTVIDIGIAALDPDRGHDVAVIASRLRIQKMVQQGALEADDEQPQSLLSQGRYIELKKYLDDAESAYRRGAR
jgi:hypothetical protein